jgi:hypothetical protein
LIKDGGAERFDGWNFWTAMTGNLGVSGTAKSGNSGFTYSQATAPLVASYQDVDVSAFADSIDQGGAFYNFSCYHRSDPKTILDKGRILLVFFNAGNTVLDTFISPWFDSPGWNLYEQRAKPPSGTRKIRVIMQIQRDCPGNNCWWSYTQFFFFDDLELNIEVKNPPFLPLQPNRLYQGEKTFFQGASADATDAALSTYGNCYSCVNAPLATVWSKFKVESSGYIYFQTEYITSDIGGAHGAYHWEANSWRSPCYQYPGSRLHKVSIPGDTINGLTPIPVSGVGYAPPGMQYNIFGRACVTAGEYYIQTTNCGLLGCNASIIPRVVFEPHTGDYCTNARPIVLDTLERKLARVLVNCHTIGESYGEDGTDMGCLNGPAGYKSSWFRVEYNDTAKADIEFKMANYTNKSSNQIRYRTYYGNCDALTSAPCNNNALTTFTLDCVRKGTYYVQVVMPADATGEIELSVETKINRDSTCQPVEIFQPNAVFRYNTACPENLVEFINNSSRGDSIGYLWDFGYNQLTDTAVNPVIEYPALPYEKDYTVKLVVYHKERGSRDSLEQTVTVPFAPEFGILTGDTMICEGDSLTLRGYLSHGTGVWNTGAVGDTLKVGRSGWYSYGQQQRPNILVNASAERDLSSGWKVNSGTWTRRSSSPLPYDSSWYFAPNTTAAGLAELEQVVDVSADSADIDSGWAKTSIRARFFTATEAVMDEAQLVLEYLNGSGGLLYVYRSEFLTASTWQELLHSRTTPKGTRMLRVRLQANNKAGGTWNSVYFDGLILKMRSACDYTESVYVQVNPKPRVDLGRDTSFCYYDSLQITPRGYYDNPYRIKDPMDGSPLKGELLLSARYVPSFGYVTLNEEVGNQFGGVNYTDSSLRIADSLDINFDLQTIDRDGIQGTSVTFYMFHAAKPSGLNHWNAAGYTIGISEYLGLNFIWINWAGSERYRVKTDIELGDGKWRNIRIVYRNRSFIFYIDGKQVGSYTDPVARTLPGYHYGFMGNNYASTQNVHRLRNFYITRNKQDVKPEMESLWQFTYTWGDNSQDAYKIATQPRSFRAFVTDKYGCVSNWDTINVQRIKTYDTLLQPLYRVCSELDTLRLYPLTGRGFFYGNTATDSSGLVYVPKAAFGRNQFVYRTTDSLGCYYLDTGLFVVDSIPDIEIEAIGPLCRNASPVQLRVNYDEGFFFGGPFVDSSGLFTPDRTSHHRNKVYYRTYGKNCVGLDSLEIVVDSIPSAAIVSAGPFCQNGGNQTLQARHNAGGRFFGASYIDSAGVFNPWLAQIGNNKIYYRFRDSRGCVNTDSTQVQVDTIPSAAIVSAGPFCQNGGNQTLQARHNGGGRFFGASYIDSAGIFNPWLAGVGQHKLYYRFRDSRGCVNTDSTQVQVDSIPSAAIVSAGPFCQNGGNQTLQAQHNAGGRFFGASYIDSAGVFNPWLAQIGNNKVYYRFRDSRGCVNTDSTQVQVDSIPSAAIVSAGPFCQNGGNQTLQARHNAGGRFFGASYIDSAGVFNPWLAQIGNNKIYYRFRDSRGCVNTDSTQVQVDTIPSAAIVSAGPFCQNGGNQTLQARHNAGGRFFGASYIDSAGIFNPWLAQIGNNKIYYRFRDSRGCVNTDSTQVQVDTIPSAAIVSAGPFCQNGGNQTLQARYNAGGRFFGASYIDSAGTFNPWLAQIGNNKVYYRFRDSRGCVNTDSIQVQVDSIPSAAIVSAGPFCQNGGNQTLQARHNAGGRFFGPAILTAPVYLILGWQA